MFAEFQNQSWAVSDAAVVVTANTDYSIDGSSSKIVWTAGKDETATLSFDSVDPSSYQEIIFHIDVSPTVDQGNIFSISVAGLTLNFERLKKGWYKVLIDCGALPSFSEIVFTSLVTNLKMFVDYAGIRITSAATSITDVQAALKETISLDYDQATTIIANAAAGDDQILVNSNAYLYEYTVATISQGGNSETIKFVNRAGELAEPLTNAYTTGAVVTLLCPTETEQEDEAQPDPVCGIIIGQPASIREPYLERMENGAKLKRYVADLEIMITIEGTSKKKVLQLTSQYQETFSDIVPFLLDGERVEMYLSDSSFSDAEVGGMIKQSFFYTFQPQGVTVEIDDSIDTINLDLQSEGA